MFNVGDVEFNPSPLTNIIDFTVRSDVVNIKPTSRDKYDSTIITRARYRGPMESYKYNLNKANIYRDLKIISYNIDICRNRLMDIIDTMLYTRKYDEAIKITFSKDLGLGNSDTIVTVTNSSVKSLMNVQDMQNKLKETYNYMIANGGK